MKRLDPAEYRPVDRMSLGDLEALRLILRGGSVIDWRRLHFETPEEVDGFLGQNLFSLDDPRDEARLRAILGQAVEYLRGAFGYRVAAQVADPADVRDLFLFASGAKEPRHRRIACVVLKCMHVVHHLEARELLFRTPIREADLSEMVDRRVMAEAKRMAHLGFPVVEFSGNVKTRASLITKLISKRESVAAQVFDRVRYRIVTPRPDQVAPVVRHLASTLFPFNYVVPGQTQNSLLRFRQIVGLHPRADDLVQQLQAPLELEAGETAPFNEFSAEGYKVLNFVVDLPVRIDAFVKPPASPAEDLGRVVFSLVEFQVVDAATARANEVGEASHERYKKRQVMKVLRRLSRGLVVPKKAPGARKKKRRGRPQR
ncbi:TIGR04552 family protein [Anaeromyxobacter paludicola]|uniref:TIGR04552 family protein n=1 Tax=Anaeromyxobacter paludicola TaxID=2918171 RepID=A0ABM7XA02_9BACT|nr:TIGR04552 family protein [Anaeromyxobacter paludicola]BDG08679.1 hypothetical protein AMPC_17920 [Anaeromyxobacter paludicola]